MWLDWSVWWPWPGLLALEAALLVGIGAGLQRLVRPAGWRRTIWQGCLVGLLLLCGLEWTGAARMANGWFGTNEASRMLAATSRDESSAVPVDASREPGARASAFASPPVSAPRSFAQTPGLPESSARAATVSRATEPAAVEESIPPQTWLLTIWLLGTICFFGRSVANQFLFAWLRRDQRTVMDPEIAKRVASLGGLLGIRRRIQVVQSGRFSGPMAFGILHPTVGLPRNFSSTQQPIQREVMLAHELAHLAAGDPLWYRLADFVTALFWWHPAVWWARRQFHTASEVAADEASLLVANGPRVLAECLVEYGARLVRPREAGSMGIVGSGFRSSLGRRVQRLMTLRERTWIPPGRWAAAMARTLGPAAFVSAAILCSAWTFPETSNKGATMKQWQHVVGVLTLATALGTGPVAGAADTPVPPVPNPEVKPGNPGQSIPASPKPEGVLPPALPPSPGNGAQSLRDKLEQIRIEEVSYDRLPLGEVVADLIRQSTHLDPAKQGVNFLFGQERPPASPPPIDPATGLPVMPVPVEDFDLRMLTIFIQPPLKDLRLVDALDAIVKVADKPIKYSIEDYAVVFTLNFTTEPHRPAAKTQVFAAPAAPPPPPDPVLPPAPSGPLQTRAFKISTNIFFASIERMFRIVIDPASADAGPLLQEKVLPKVGVRLASPESLVLYNHLTGVLFVRGSAEELDAVRAAVETLGGAPVTGAATSTKSSFLQHLAEGPHTHIHRAVTGMFDALGNLAPPPFNRSSR
jgi:beta-lactamase regulating signal transducer with metallopeptidase domain